MDDLRPLRLAPLCKESSLLLGSLPCSSRALEGTARGEDAELQLQGWAREPRRGFRQVQEPGQG